MLAGFVVFLCALPMGHGQASPAAAPEKPSFHKPFALPDLLPEKPTVPPTFTVPVEPIGFATPGPIYLGLRFSLASLDFLDENRLLFTFRVPGLMHREAGAAPGSVERQIRAVVVALPEGKIEAEALWTVHDRHRYLWILKNGHFLLRDRDGLQQGDARLELKPLLQFPGPLLWLEMDPSQQFLVTNSREPEASQERSAEGKISVDQPSSKAPSLYLSQEKSPAGEAPSPGTASAATDTAVSDASKPPEQTDLVVRILRRESGKVMLVSRAHDAVHLPINSDGYLDSSRGNGQQWLLNLNYFSGGSTALGRVDSSCDPSLDFISQREVLAMACAGDSESKMVAIDPHGRHLWEDLLSSWSVNPLVRMAPDGSRLALETLAVTHAVNGNEPIVQEDVKGQLIRVIDAADGKVVFEAMASPPLDAGGNVAISPSGRRVALITDGTIQVFDLPAPAALPDTDGNQTGH
jgi:hypothetical protein